MSTERLGAALHVEVGLIVGTSGTLAADEVQRNYLILCARGTEHHTARDLALGMAAETLEAHARVAGIAAAAASEYRRSAALLREAAARSASAEAA